MLEQYTDIFNKALELTEKRHNIYLEDSKKYPSGIIKMEEIQECPEYEEMDRELFKYLNSLDYEAIKILQTIMLLGRQKDYNKKLFGEAIYVDYREGVDGSIGWHSKELDINYMTEKEPLNEYLKDGLKILGIIQSAI